MKALKLSGETREAIFVDIIHELWKYNDAGLHDIAEQAGVHWTTLYAWKGGATNAPRLDKIAAVARVLGYDIILQKRKGPVIKHLRSVR